MGTATPAAMCWRSPMNSINPMLGSYYDIALRDLGLAIGAFALARLSEEHGR